MKAEGKEIQVRVVAITLTLTEEEANWLQGVMQNPLHGETLSEERLDQAEFRKRLFTCLQEVVHVPS